jgi:hypothetical protein
METLPSGEMCEGFGMSADKSRKSMALFQESDGDPRERFADALCAYGAAGDAACGNAPGFAARKAAAAVAFAEFAELPQDTVDALYFAGILHAVGGIGAVPASPAERWESPPRGVRICAQIPGLPSETADLVRWQLESWDGTGYPDQLRWDSIPLAAQLLLLAETVLSAQDAEEALERVNAESGRSIAPAAARLYADWLRDGGTIRDATPPVRALDASALANAIKDDHPMLLAIAQAIR